MSIKWFLQHTSFFLFNWANKSDRRSFYLQDMYINESQHSNDLVTTEIHIHVLIYSTFTFSFYHHINKTTDCNNNHCITLILINMVHGSHSQVFTYIVIAAWLSEKQVWYEEIKIKPNSFKYHTTKSRTCWVTCQCRFIVNRIL